MAKPCAKCARLQITSGPRHRDPDVQRRHPHPSGLPGAGRRQGAVVTEDAAYWQARYEAATARIDELTVTEAALEVIVAGGRAVLVEQGMDPADVDAIIAEHDLGRPS